MSEIEAKMLVDYLFKMGIVDEDETNVIWYNLEADNIVEEYLLELDRLKA